MKGKERKLKTMGDGERHDFIEGGERRKVTK